MHNAPYWYKVLNHFAYNSYFQNGLTIPFLIGSRSIVEPNEKLQSISELIAEINTSTYYVSMLECDWAGAIVCSLSDEINKNIYGGFNQLVLIDYTFRKLNTIEEIICQLERDYSDVVGKGTYSRIDGEWVVFTAKDIQCLTEII